MRILLVTTLATLTAAGTAGAEPLEQPVQVTRWRLETGAGIGSSDRNPARAEATASGSVSREGGYGYGILLPLIDSSAELTLAGGGDDDGLAVSHRSRAVLIGPPAGTRDALLPAEVRYQLDHHVRPELSSKLGLLRRTYSRAGFGWTLGFADIGGWRLMSMGLDVAAIRQELPDGAARHTQYDPQLTFATWTRQRSGDEPELQLDIITGGGPAVAVEDGPDASVGRIDFVAARNVPLWGGLYVDGSVGVTGTGSFSASVTSGDGEPDWETTVMTEDLPLMSVPAAAARLHGTIETAGGDQVGVALGAARTLDLTGQVDLALDDRATGTVRWIRPRGELVVEGFAARTQLWTDTETSETSRTGGGLLAYRRAVGRQLSVTATVEVARSFYAVVDGDPEPRPETAARGGLTVSRHFGTGAR